MKRFLRFAFKSGPFLLTVSDSSDRPIEVMTPSEIKVRLAEDQWHTLTVTHRGDDIEVSIDGNAVFTGADKTYAHAGKVGVWTKADSLTYFDGLTVEVLP